VEIFALFLALPVCREFEQGTQMSRSFIWQVDGGDVSLFDHVRLFGNNQVLIEQKDWECPVRI